MNLINKTLWDPAHGGYLLFANHPYAGTIRFRFKGFALHLSIRIAYAPLGFAGILTS